MRFDIITLFPELFAPHLTLGVTRRAFASGQVDVKLWPLRDFADNAYHRVDARPYGGGPGMVMLVEPLERALTAVRRARLDVMGLADAAQSGAESAGDASAAPVVLFTPTGRRIDQRQVRDMAASPGAILVCGRYEGIDQRFIDRHVDIELSLGDFVLSGGELPALALLDAVARLQDGVLGDALSHQQDSFSDGLLDCPHFSRPEVLELDDGGHHQDHDHAVPPVLMSGHHQRIARWRREQSLRLTAHRRPDLITTARALGLLTQEDESFLTLLVL